jgi:hypothetical protein
MIERPKGLGTMWQTSSFTSGGNQCVEAVRLPTAVGVRDSKNPSGPRLRLTAHAWGRLVTALKG